MKILETEIDGLCVAESIPIQDERGRFSRLFCHAELHQLIGNRVVTQINHSVTRQAGAIRGMHFQHPPAAEMKLIRCLKGRVYDVAVDLRHGSPSFLSWYAVELTPVTNTMYVIPEGFAHGFQVLEPDSELLYLHTAAYAPEHEAGIRYDDPIIGIDWPLAITDISARDSEQPLLTSNFSGITL